MSGTSSRPKGKVSESDLCVVSVHSFSICHDCSLDLLLSLSVVFFRSLSINVVVVVVVDLREPE